MLFLDRLRNLVTGLGGAKDKRTGNEFALNLLNRQQLDAMHRSDWMSRKIVDIIPQDMTREWRRWQASKPQIEALEKEEKRLALPIKVTAALQAARLYGGAGLVMGIGNDDPIEPVRLDSISRGDLKYAHVMTRYELTAGGQIIRDVESEWFGEPEYYNITLDNGKAAQIHPSRVVRFLGAPIINRDVNPDGWGDSILQIVYDAVQNAASAQEHVAALIPEAKVDIIHIPDLAEHLATEESTKRLTDRIQYAQTIQSIFGKLLLEGDGKTQGEVWQQKTINFTAFPDLLRQYLQVAAGAADIPVTRLLGQSPSGMNATGESDMRNYYDNVGARRSMELAHPLTRLDEVLIRSSTSERDEAIHALWPSLWQPQPKELAEIAKMRAETSEKYANMAVMPDAAFSRAVQNQLVESGDYPGLEQALEEFGSEPDDMEEPAPEEEDEPAEAE
ncbi:DUF1073 domain-containing protein [Marinicauda sp. Alg238-R41]|uniref:DUF1073 domain-containing protein n=1 Tax=Marinicauda sp. Alg238-R41 TaxID=2993447 RepID=UPI0022E6A36E|nr:DUF1073 domain-containing protein [Marinicauda sp. Alg238-R41]